MTRGTAAAALSAGNVFGDVFDVLPTPVAVLDGGGRVVALNRAWRAEPLDQALQPGDNFVLSCLDHATDSEEAVALAAATRAILDGSTGEVVAQVAFRSRGQPRTFAVSIRRLSARDGAVVLREDVTDRQRGVRPQTEDVDRYRILAEQSPEAVWMAGRDRKMVQWTRAWHEKTGQDEEQASGTGWLAAIHPFHRARLVRIWSDAATRRQAWHFDVPVCTAPERKFRWHTILSRPVLDAAGAVTHWVGLVVDSHDQRIGARALERSEQRFRRLADHAPVKVWMADTRGKAVWFNRRWLDFRGRRLSEEVGDGWLDGVAPEDRPRLQRIFENAIRERRPFEIDFRLLRKDGELRWISGWMVPSEDAGGLFDGYVGSAYDVTDRKRDERNRIVLIEELNHRVKNTLSIIQAIARQSLKSVPAPERDAFAHRLSALSQCHDLLTASHWRGVAVEALVGRTLAPFRAPEGARRWQIDGPPVVVSPRTALSLALVLHELATNALKYGALATEEGTLTIRWRIDTAADGARRLSLEWRERTSSPVSTPRHAGFGTRLLEALSRQDGNHVDHEVRPDGVVCRLAVSIEEVPA